MEGQIYSESASEEAVAAMVTQNPNFDVEQCMLYETSRTHAARNAVSA